MSNTSTNDSLPPYDQARNIENRNYLSPVGFRLAIDRMKGVDFFCQSASIPAISMGSADTFTRFNKIPQPGDELAYEDLFIQFLVDENLKNWYQVHDWMREIATPYSSKEFGYKRGDLNSQNPVSRRVTQDSTSWDNQWRSDCSLFVLSSNYRPVAEFVFRDAFPVNLTTLNFDASVPDVNYFQAQVTLRYSYYDYYVYEAATATDASMTPTYRKSGGGATLS